MSEFIYLLTLCVMFGTILAIFGMRYYSVLQQAKARLANDDAYRLIAEKAVAVQSENGALLSSIQTSLADVTGRLAAVEKILKEVG